MILSTVNEHCWEGLIRMKGIELTEKRAEVLLILLVSARATSFMFNKLLIDSITRFALLSLRFGTAFILLMLLFGSRIFRNFDWKDALRGAVIGCCFFLTMSCELTGVPFIASSKASFIENTAIVLVPLAEAALAGRFPGRQSLIAALLAFAGVALLSVKSGSFSLEFGKGECWLMMAACCYTLAIMVTSRLSRRGDAFTMGIFQVGTEALLSTIAAFATGTAVFPHNGTEWAMILLLAVVCTGFGFSLQPVAQSKVSPEKTSLLCAVNPMVAGLLGVLFMKETLGAAGFAGCALILLALVTGRKK